MGAVWPFIAFSGYDFLFRPCQASALPRRLRRTHRQRLRNRGARVFGPHGLTRGGWRRSERRISNGTPRRWSWVACGIVVISRAAPDGQSFGQAALGGVLRPPACGPSLPVRRPRESCSTPSPDPALQTSPQGWLGTGRCLYEIVNDACRILPRRNFAD